MSTFNIFDPNILSLLEANKDSDKAFIYIANTDKYNHGISTFWECLSIKEQEQAVRYYTKLLSEQFIISHGLLRHILSYHIKQPPKNLQFTINRYGKPFLSNSRVKFNMSHSHNIVAYIIAHNYEVGIDVEYKDTTLNIMELFDLILSPKETILLKSVEPAAQHTIFFNLWTKKEALIKAIGNGLSYPVNTIDALPITVDNKISLSNGCNCREQELYAYTLELLPDYSIAIASDSQINQIIYLEGCTQLGIFNSAMVKYLHK